MENSPSSPQKAEIDPITNPNLTSLSYEARKALAAQGEIKRRQGIAERFRQRRAVRAQRRREVEAPQHAAESKRGAFAFDLLGRAGIRQAARAERDPETRRARRAQLTQQWREFTRKAFNRVTW